MFIVNIRAQGPVVYQLTKSLVNGSLKFQTFISEIRQNLFVEKM